MTRYIYQVFGRFLPQVLSLYLYSYFLKYVGVDNFSNFNVVLLYFTIIFSVFSGAVDIIYQRIHDAENVINIFIYKIISYFLIIIPLILILNNIYNFEIILVVVLTSAFLMQSIFETLLTTFRILDKDYHVVLPKIFQILILLFLVGYYKPSSLLEYSEYLLLSWLFIIFIYLPIALKGIELNLNALRIFIYENFKSVFYLGITICATQVYMNTDFLLLDYFHGSLIAGSYKVSLIISQSFIPIIGATSTIYLSNLAHININDPFFKRKIQIATKQQTILVFAISILFFISAYFLLDLLFSLLFKNVDKNYISVSLILIISSVINAYSMVWSYLLIKLEQEEFIFKSTIYTIVFSAITAFILIPIFGLNGAIAVNIVTQLFLLTLYKVKIIKFFKEC